MSRDIQASWAHQIEGVRRALPLPEYAFFWEMGCGKSRVLIDTLRGKFNARQRVLRTIIFAPPIVLSNWRDEWLKFSKIDPRAITVLRGHARSRLSLFNKAGFERLTGDALRDGQPKGHIFITNYESLLMPELYEAFLSWAPEVLVLDESHKCKSHQAKRSKLMEALANPFDRKLKKPLPTPQKFLLSGSPILNSPLDIYMQYLILDGGATFGSNFFAFRARYFYDRNAGMPKDRHFPDWRILPLSEEEMNRLIYQKAMRVEKKDCLDLPPMVRQTLKVGMTPEQKRMYEEMKKDFITYMESKACVAQLAVTKALRLMQITSGFAKMEDGEHAKYPSTPKMEALRELLEELTPHHKVLIWAVWKENYGQIRQVCESLGVECVEIHGEVTDRQKLDAVALFKDEAKVRVLIGHPGSGGIGINLVAASYSIFYSRTFSLEQSLQAEARNHRGGSEIHAKITRIDLVCENSIDELVQEKLHAKQEISERVLRDFTQALKGGP